jgi:hypothetical protein
MTKVNGPFMSLSASGTFADTLTASIWKGRPYIRQRVIPSNPRTDEQQQTRLNKGETAKACAMVLTSTMDNAKAGSTFFTSARDQAPSGQSWISFIQKKMNNSETAAAVTAYGLVSGTIKGYFDTAAALADAITYVPTWLTITPDNLLTAGEQLYLLAYFASVYLTGEIKTSADTAIVGANQNDVTAFEADVHETSFG